MSRLALLLPFLLLTGCVSTVTSIATAPIRAVGWTADKLTTSQSESDRNRGRRDRKAEEKQAREARKAEKARQKQLRAQQAVDDRT
jgi:cell shape-determining protein MreC